MIELPLSWCLFVLRVRKMVNPVLGPKEDSRAHNANLIFKNKQKTSANGELL